MHSLTYFSLFFLPPSLLPSLLRLSISLLRLSPYLSFYILIYLSSFSLPFQPSYLIFSLSLSPLSPLSLLYPHALILISFTLSTPSLSFTSRLLSPPLSPFDHFALSLSLSFFVRTIDISMLFSRAIFHLVLDVHKMLSP